MAYTAMTPWEYLDVLEADKLNLIQTNIQDNHDVSAQNKADIATNVADIATNVADIQNIKDTQYLTAAYWE